MQTLHCIYILSWYRRICWPCVCLVMLNLAVFIAICCCCRRYKTSLYLDAWNWKAMLYAWLWTVEWWHIYIAMLFLGQGHEVHVNLGDRGRGHRADISTRRADVYDVSSLVLSWLIFYVMWCIWWFWTYLMSPTDEIYCDCTVHTCIVTCCWLRFWTLHSLSDTEDCVLESVLELDHWWWCYYYVVV